MKNNYPTGAEALLIALNTPSPKGTIGIPVLLWGKPGVGKSSFVESLQNERLKVLTLIASIHDPTDFSGLPVHHEGKVKYAVPEWVDAFRGFDAAVLFLDELSTAPPAVQASLLRVVLERKVGFHELPEHVRIIAAANPPDLMVGGWDLSPPLRNRFVHLDWEIPTEIYLNALSDSWAVASLPVIDPKEHARLLPEWKLKIAAFLKISPNLLEASPEDNPYGFATPRTWDFAACLLASCELLGLAPTGGTEAGAACIQLVRGCLGDGVAVAFFEFLRNIKLPDPADILDGKAALNIPALNDSELFVIFGSMNGVLKSRFDTSSLLPSTMIYFELIREVFADGRRDLIYVSLKQISKAGLLMKALGRAQRESPARVKTVMNAISELFSDEGLKEFIDVFEG